MKSEHATAAQKIRKELKTNFPKIKFSVTSKIYTGGSSIHIDYNNGVPSSEIEKITNKYEYGHFNGMEDLYEYSNVNDDLPQVKYIIIQRNITDDIKETIKKKLEKSFGIDFSNEKKVFEKFHCWPDQVIFRETAKQTF